MRAADGWQQEAQQITAILSDGLRHTTAQPGGTGRQDRHRSINLQAQPNTINGNAWMHCATSLSFI